MAIPQHTIDQILDRVDIVDLIAQRVKLKKTGRTYSGCCPFHQEKTPSFHVYRDKAYYHCFGCQANGNAIRFLMELENRNFIDVIKDLAQQTGIELPKDDFDAKKATYQRKVMPTAVPNTAPNTTPPHTQDIEVSDHFHPSYDPFEAANTGFHDQESILAEHTQQEISLYDLLESIAQYYQQQLQHAAHAQNYFNNRALTPEVQQAWRLGYAPQGWQHLEQAFPQDINGLKALGLVRENDKHGSFSLLRDRVIFPIRDTKGRVVGFGGRALNDEVKPKYINSPDSEVFHKNQLLYGLYEGRKAKAQDWLMVEGYMDVIALHQAGIYGAVATLGTASNAEHLNILFRQNPKLTLAFDGDNAGQRAAWRTLEIALPLLQDGRELRFFILPEQHDPDSLIRQVGLEQFLQQWQNAPLLSDYLYAQLTKRHNIQTPEGKGIVMAELRQLSNQMPNGSYKYLLSQLFRDRMGFGRKKIDQTQQDRDLNFSRLDRKALLVALLLHYPVLFPQFETLRAYTSTQSLLGKLLATLDTVYEQLPNDIEASRFFALGACQTIYEQLKPILQSANINSLVIESPEDLDRHAQSLFILLKQQYLKQKLKKSSSIQESKNIMQQLHELSKQINTMTINQTH